MAEGAQVDKSQNPLDCLVGPVDDVARMDQGSFRKLNAPLDCSTDHLDDSPGPQTTLMFP